jgi:hypothetical protein
MDFMTYIGIKNWFTQNARQLELSLWDYFFEDGSQNKVLEVLALYQNDDGGFGQLLEPDNWNPNSTPSTTLFALNILKSIGFHDMKHAIYQGIIRYLSSGKDRKEYGWMFSVPENDNFPHAPWWGYKEDANLKESVGITAEFSAFILRYIDSRSDLYQTALEFTKLLTDRMMNAETHGDMGIGGYKELVEVIIERKIRGYDYEALELRMSDLITKGIEHDVNKWKYYGYRPSDYIPNPESKYYEANREIVEVEIEYLMDTKPENDVWPITWTWFENNEKYAKEFAVSEVRWKGIKAIEKVRFLKAFGRIDLT